MRVMSHQNRLPGEAVDISSLEVFKPGWMRLLATWSSGRFPCCCPWHRGWNQIILKMISSNPNHSMVRLFCDFPSGFLVWSFKQSIIIFTYLPKCTSAPWLIQKNLQAVMSVYKYMCKYAH